MIYGAKTQLVLFIRYFIYLFIYFFLFTPFVSVNSAANSHVLKRVKDEIYHYVRGQDRCAWSDVQIEGKVNFIVLILYYILIEVQPGV